VTKSPPSAFSIAQIILEKASFSHGGDPFTVAPVANESVLPNDISVNVEAAHSIDRKSSVVRLRIVAEGKELVDEVKYVFDVTVSGIFDITAPLPTDQESAFVVSAAAILLPFAREVVANITLRGRFGPMWLQPINIRAALGDAIKTAEMKPVDRDSKALSAALPRRPRRKAT
jgi:preprotein translocase subunit SecB